MAELSLFFLFFFGGGGGGVLTIKKIVSWCERIHLSLHSFTPEIEITKKELRHDYIGVLFLF